MSINKAIVGFVNHKLAEGLTDRSVSSYERLLTKWVIHTGDNDITQVTSQDIRSYLAWLRTDYQPIRFNGQTHPLSPKTIRNIWVTLASFYKWATMEFSIPNPMDGIPAPRFQQAPVNAFTKAEVGLMLKACAYTREADTTFRRSSTYHRPTARRDRAIILTLLDTGLRAMELCLLKTGDVDLKNGKVEVKHGVRGGAKGGKGRIVFLGKTARRAVWRYLASREDDDDPQAPLFLGRSDRIMTPSSLRQLIKNLAEKASVGVCHRSG